MVTTTDRDGPLPWASAVARHPEHHQPAAAATEQRLWDALYLARVGKAAGTLADLEDAVFRFYLPMARTLARNHALEGAVAAAADQAAADQAAAEQAAAEQAAELGLAHAVLAWRQRQSGGFRRFARSAILRQLGTRS